MNQGTLRIGVLGAGNWARRAHIPGWQRDGRAHVAVVCDVEPERARELATWFDVPEATDDWQAVVTRPDVDVIVVVTPSHTHFTLASAAIEAGKHVLCVKPVAYDFRQTRAAAEMARAKGLKTKLGFTFRYSPGVQYARSLIDEGFTGIPFLFNGFEQNSQWLDPQTPLRQVDHTADQSTIQTSSLGATSIWSMCVRQARRISSSPGCRSRLGSTCFARSPWRSTIATRCARRRWPGSRG